MLTTHNKKPHLNNLIIFFLAICGNSTLFGIDIFFIIFLFHCVYFLNPWEKRFPLNINTAISCTLLALITIKSATLEIPYNQFYFFWPIKATLLFVLIIYNCKATENKLALNYEGNYTTQTAAICIFLIIFLSLALFFGQTIDGRLHFIYGPNMLYRVAVIASLLPFICKKASLISKLLLIGTGISVGVLTGSKGFWITLILCGLIVIQMEYKLLSRKGTILTTSIFALLGLVLSNSPDLRVIQYLRNFDIESTDRLNFMLNHNWYSFTVFGNTYEDYFKNQLHGFQYPHNIFVELIYYYGIPGWILSVLITLSAVLSTRLKVNRLWLICGLVFLVGSMMSGDLSDNFSSVSIFLAMLTKGKSNACNNFPIRK
jgi:hypothetical protein